MKKPLSIIFVALMLALCILPTAALICGYVGENRENRPLAREAKLISRGELNLEYPSDFDSYYKDHFGFREEMVTAFNSLTVGLFHDTLNEKVVIGKNGFLYYTETLDDYTGQNRMTDADIQDAATVLRMLADYARANGMSFTFASAPNKSTIYPEYMPDRYIKTEEATNYERLYKALANVNVETVDLASLLIEAKDAGALYYDLDTHWNDRGALIGYRAIMESACGESDSYFDSYLEREETPGENADGDLNNFIFPARSGRMETVSYGVAQEYTVDKAENAAVSSRFSTAGGGEAKLLMFRDSFTEALIPYISNNTKSAVYDSEFPYNLTADLSDYDAIVIELVERNIPNLILSAPVMPALEVTAADPAYISAPTDGLSHKEVEAEAYKRTRSGYNELYGCYYGERSNAIFLACAYQDGSTHVFEAFPVLECEPKAAGDAGGAADAHGFVVTLPSEFSSPVSVRVCVGAGESAAMELGF